MNVLKMIMITLITMFLVLMTVVAFGQSFELRAVDKGNGVIGVEMRETSGSGTPTTNMWVTDIVFGITWDTAYGVDLGAITSDYHIAKSGTRTVRNDKHFQAFYANNTPYSVPANWSTGNWEEIASIPNDGNGTGTGTFEMAASSFHVTTDPNLGLNLTDYTPSVTGSASGVALPVEWLEFKGNQRGEVVQLTWSTATEVNNKHFEVERANSNGKFVKIGEVKGAGNTSEIQHYEWWDFDPVDEANYYRIKQVDFDGEVNYSKVIKVEFDVFNLTGVKVYPIPAVDILTIDGFQNAEVSRIDMYGRKHQVEVDKNNVLNVSGWKAGYHCLFFRELNGGTERITVRKILKL